MSFTVRYPVEKTMALGGVPTGRRKANDADSAHGIMKYNGCMASFTAWKQVIKHTCNPSAGTNGGTLIGFGGSHGVTAQKTIIQRG